MSHVDNCEPPLSKDQVCVASKKIKEMNCLLIQW